MPEALANDRIAVRTGDNSMAYIKDARWADEPAKLFADVLAETISERTGRLVVDRRQYAMAPGARLTGRLLITDSRRYTLAVRPASSRRGQARRR